MIEFCVFLCVIFTNSTHKIFTKKGFNRKIPKLDIKVHFLLLSLRQNFCCWVFSRNRIKWYIFIMFREKKGRKTKMNKRRILLFFFLPEKMKKVVGYNIWRLIHQYIKEESLANKNYIKRDPFVSQVWFFQDNILDLWSQNFVWERNLYKKHAITTIFISFILFCFFVKQKKNRKGRI